ncbi:hypothetical protein [Arenicella sp. 4NH20-0111]|uniref:hypothetical protein n=1 Tax=Arenicella sp. 4NH20-0111 TaxID=3127648 RepID=UPI00333FB656
MTKYLLLLIAFVFPLNSLAGGMSFTVVVTDVDLVEDSAHSFKLDLKRTKESEYGDGAGCESIVIAGKYDYDQWVNYRRPMSSNNHQEALEHLLNSKGLEIRFGTFGSGLKKISKCKFESKGLMLLNNYKGQATVYSIYNKI